MPDVVDYLPYADDFTSDVLADAFATLASLRGLDQDPDPAVALHILASLQQQLQTELVHAVLIANDHGYTPDQIAVVLGHTT